MEERPRTVQQEEEIDLYELYLRIRRRWRLIAGVVLLSVALSLVYVFTAVPLYESSFIVRTYVITPKETVRYVELAGDLLKKRKTEELSELLGVDREVVESLRDIRPREVRSAKDIVEITLTVTDPRAVPPLAEGLVNYLNRNPYVLERLSLKEKELKRRREMLARRIRALEETRRVIGEMVREGRSVYFNPTEIDRTIEEFSRELVNLEAQLTLLKGFELSVKPAEPLEPTKPKKVMIVTVALLSSLLLGVFLALFLEWLQDARRKHSEGTSGV